MSTAVTPSGIINTKTYRQQHKADHAGRAIVLYDGDCPFCRQSIALLKRLDLFQVLSYVNARNSTHLAELNISISEEQLLEQMHILTPNRSKTYVGFGALRWMTWRLPLLAPVAPLLYIPGVPTIGQRFYKWIAKNRLNLVPCDKDGCAVDMVALVQVTKNQNPSSTTR